MKKQNMETEKRAVTRKNDEEYRVSIKYFTPRGEMKGGLPMCAALNARLCIFQKEVNGRYD